MEKLGKQQEKLKLGWEKLELIKELERQKLEMENLGKLREKLEKQQKRRNRADMRTWNLS